MGISGAKPSLERLSPSNTPFVPSGEAGALTEPPEELTKEARANWDVLLPYLNEMGVFKTSDSLLLVEACEMLAHAQRTRRVMKRPTSKWWHFERDMTSEQKARYDEEQYTAAGKAELADLWVMSTAYKRLRVDYNDTMKLFNSTVSEFGVTPVARMRLGLMALEGASLADALRDDADEAPPGPGPGGPVLDGTVLD